MEQQSTLRLMAVAGLGLLAAAIIAIIRVFEFNAALPPEAWKLASENLAAEYSAALSNARQRWDLQGIAHYELVIERKARPIDPQTATCRQDVEVRDETVADILEDTCADDPIFHPPTGGDSFPLTVSGLFDQIARDTRQITWSAEGIGCKFLAVNASYDDNWGYPHRVAYRWQQPPPEYGYPMDPRYFLPGTPTPAASCAGALIVDGPEWAITIAVLP